MTDKTEYLSVAATAKLVRAALKKSFPNAKFSVRSSTYAGGASIDIRWMDGPTARMVDEIAKQFSGKRFDGMIDMGYSVDHWLSPDGSITIAHNPGSRGSGGLDAGEDNPKPHPDARRVHFGSGYVHANRETSVDLLTRVRNRLDRKGYPVEVIEIHQSKGCETGYWKVTSWDKTQTRGIDMEREMHMAVSSFMSVRAAT